jgi:hypothetical protein
MAGLNTDCKETRMFKRLVVLAVLGGFVPFIAGGCDSDAKSGARASRAASLRAARERAGSQKVCREREAAKRHIPRECRLVKRKHGC